MCPGAPIVQRMREVILFSPHGSIEETNHACIMRVTSLTDAFVVSCIEAKQQRQRIGPPRPSFATQTT